MKRLLVCLALLAGCSQSAPANKPAATPTFDAHCRACKQCGGGLLDENGNEQSICDEGFRLWQADLRAASGKR
jgi:hypothetical protein